MYALWISRTECQGFTPDNVDHEDYEKSLLVSSTGVLGTRLISNSTPNSCSSLNAATSSSLTATEVATWRFPSDMCMLPMFTFFIGTPPLTSVSTSSGVSATMKIFWRGLALPMTSMVFCREETRSDAGGSGHLHEVLTHGVGRHVVVGDEDEVGAQGGVPLGSDLTMDQSVIDAGKKNVGFCHVDQLPFVIC